jgi:hypothetical protein
MQYEKGEMAMRERGKTDRDYRKYFDKYEFDRIVKLKKYHPVRAMECFKSYVERYPLDVMAHVQYASCLITFANYEEAEKELEISKGLLSKCSIFKENEIKARDAKHTLLYNTLRLYAYQNKANEFLSLYYENYKFLKDIKPDAVFYFRNMIGEKVVSENYIPSYTRSQIVDYSEERFIEHVKKHDADFNENDREISPSYFNSDFPFEKVLDEIKKKIPGDTKRNRGFYSNIYTFKYDECGKSSNRTCDFFRIVTFNNSDKFITMYPINEEEDVSFIDLNYLNEKEEEQVKVKRMSQIDKFYRRYSR